MAIFGQTLICFLDITLYPSKEVEVVINARWCHQLRLFDELGWVALSGALRPLLMTLVARQRACARWAARTTVLWRVGVTGASQHNFVVDSAAVVLGPQMQHV
jgi:hypothetical protein